MLDINKSFLIATCSTYVKNVPVVPVLLESSFCQSSFSEQNTMSKTGGIFRGIYKKKIASKAITYSSLLDSFTLKIMKG
jgi:hypothetical protein